MSYRSVFLYMCALCVAVVALSCAPRAAHAQAGAPSRAQREVIDHEALRLQLLAYHLERVRAEAAFDRKLAGWIFVCIGTTFTGVDLMIAPHMIEEPSEVSPASMVLANPARPFGAGLATLGTLILVLPPREEVAPTFFIDRARANLAAPYALQDLIVEGEQLLTQLADEERNSRYIYAGTYATIGLLPFALILQGTTPEDTTGAVRNWFPFSALFGGLALYEALVTSEAEDALDDYARDLKHSSAERRTSQQPHTLRLRVAPSLSPGVGGLAASVAW